jgi:SGNH domain (fused to AT3 domains)
MTSCLQMSTSGTIAGACERACTLSNTCGCGRSGTALVSEAGIRSRFVWRLAGVGLTLSMLATSPGTAAHVVSSVEASSSPGTAAQVAASVKASTSIASLPSDLIPSLASVQSESGYWGALSTDYINNYCNAWNTPSLRTSPAACFYGDLSSKRTVILYGDSNAANWAPAADGALTRLKLRLALIAMPGCAPGFMSYLSSQVAFTQRCETWHAHLAPLVRRLHPMAVLLVSAGFVRPSPRGWPAAVNKAFEVLSGGNAKAKRIVVGTSPHFQAPVPQCLASYPGAVQTCDINYSKSTSLRAQDLARDAQVAAASHAILMPTAQWLCSEDLCSPIVHDMMVYLDRDHFSIVYSKWLSGVFQAALTKCGL